VFLDADARPAPGLVRALAQALGDADLVTGAPRFRVPAPTARALHASMLATVVLRSGPTDVPGWQPAPSRAVANGQCLAARRDGLLAAGGWARVRGSVTEDVALARALRADGRRLAFVDASGLLEVEPYATLGETWRGWGRSLLAADVTPPARIAEELALLWLTMGLPLPRLLARRAGPLDAALLLVRLALLAALGRTYRPRGAAFWLSPLLDPATLVRLTGSVLVREQTWRGRAYRV
jgi:dolichol-phosphate mannosyltransferase